MSDNIRPQNFNEFIGNDRVKQVLQILVKSAKKKGTAPSHILLSGPAGHGKTSLGRIMAEELGTRLHEIIASNINSPEQLTQQMVNLEEGDIFFIDEIHSLNRECQEILYGSMEDFKIPIILNDFNDLMKNIGMKQKQPSRIDLNLKPFCLIGASTRSGTLDAPLRSRFIQSLTLEPYTNEDLQQIAINASRKLAFPISKKVGWELAIRSRFTARLCVNNVRWLIEFCTANDLKPNLEALNDAMILKDIDEHGLTKTDRDYLNILIASNGKPVGLETLAMSLNEDIETLKQSVEPYLIQAGFIRRASRGRIALEKAYEVFSKIRMVA